MGNYNTILRVNIYCVNSKQFNKTKKFYHSHFTYKETKVKKGKGGPGAIQTVSSWGIKPRFVRFQSENSAIEIRTSQFFLLLPKLVSEVF